MSESKKQIKLEEIRILPPLAIARFGSAKEPMPSFGFAKPIYELGIDNYRDLQFEDSFVIDGQGEISQQEVNDEVTVDDFREGDKIKPVAPFFELWGVFSDNDKKLVPLTVAKLKGLGINLKDIKCSCEMVNRKTARRSFNTNRDVISAECGRTLADLGSHKLSGKCNNFEGSIPLGELQIPSLPDDEVIKVRFVPPDGKVYGDEKLYIKEATEKYITTKNKEAGEKKKEAKEQKENIVTGFEEIELNEPPYVTIPEVGDNTFSLYGTLPEETMEMGLFDNSSDGVLTFSIDDLEASARIATAPPDFSPDTHHVRTIEDDVEQLLLGGEVSFPNADEDNAAKDDAAKDDAAKDNAKLYLEVTDILQRSLDTMRLLRPVAVFLKWTDDDAWAPDDKAELFEGAAKESKGDYIEILGYHTIPLQAAICFLRNPTDKKIKDYFQSKLSVVQGRLRKSSAIGNLHQMPTGMRGSDLNMLTLTTRQQKKIKLACERLIEGVVPEGIKKLASLKSPGEIAINDVMAQVRYRPKGNPITTTLASTAGNCSPGLELDFRVVFKHLLTSEKGEIHLHEVSSLALPGANRLAGPIKTVEPPIALDNVGLKEVYYRDRFNHIADVSGEFKAVIDITDYTVQLEKVIDEKGYLNNNQPGELTQSLCSPWQADYHSCVCSYWSASAPDFINLDDSNKEGYQGHAWLSNKDDLVDIDAYPNEEPHTRQQTYIEWENEKVFRFVIKGRS